MDETGWHPYQCRNTASVERDGKHLCRVHDPIARAERRAARGPSKFQRELEQMRRERERLAALEAVAVAADRFVTYSDSEAESDPKMLDYLYYQKEYDALKTALRRLKELTDAKS